VYGTPLLGVGLAFKPNVADDRESPSVDVLSILAERGAAVSAWDPLVDDERVAAHGFTPAHGPAGDHAVAVVLTDHDVIDYEALAAAVPLVFDARGAFARRGISVDNVVSL
jgi:UDP-N-acetyl-D-glucosamine dehydrogenase